MAAFTSKGRGSQAACGLLAQVFDSAPCLLMAKAARFDFVLLDGEHGDLDLSRLGSLLLMADALELPTLVRVPELSRFWISHTLDLGASAVMVPMIETPAQARQLVEWAKYPPLGQRSYSGGGHTRYGASGNHQCNMTRANQRTQAFVQIETQAGVAAVEEILAVPGIAGAIVGPCDLAISLGHPDKVGCDPELACIDRVCDACVTQGKGFGIIGGQDLLARYAKDLSLMVSAIDSHLIRDVFASARNAYDELLAFAKE